MSACVVYFMLLYVDDVKRRERSLGLIFPLNIFSYVSPVSVPRRVYCNGSQEWENGWVYYTEATSVKCAREITRVEVVQVRERPTTRMPPRRFGEQGDGPSSCMLVLAMSV